MKPRFSRRPEAGLTIFEVGVVVAIALFLMALLLPTLHPRPQGGRAISCINNLKQVGLAYRIWAGDNNDAYPMGLSVTYGGTLEMVATGDVLGTYMVMSNELSTPRLVHCPADAARTFASTFSTLSNSNVSYFVGVDVTNDSLPQLILSGDSCLEIAGKPVGAGRLLLWTNAPVSWSRTRHVGGNIGLADGSVQSMNDFRLHDCLIQTCIATNHLAIP